MNVTVLEYDPQMAQEELREVLSQMDPAALAAELFGETSSDAAVPDLPKRHNWMLKILCVRNSIAFPRWTLPRWRQSCSEILTCRSSETAAWSTLIRKRAQGDISYV